MADWGALYLEGRRVGLEQVRTTEEMRRLMEERIAKQQYQEEYLPQLREQQSAIQKQRREFQREYESKEREFSEGMIGKKEYTRAIESFERFDIEAANQMMDVYANMLTSGNRFAMEAGKAGMESLNQAYQQKSALLRNTRDNIGRQEANEATIESRKELEATRQSGLDRRQEDEQEFTAEQNRLKAQQAASGKSGEQRATYGKVSNLIQQAEDTFAGIEGSTGWLASGAGTGLRKKLDEKWQMAQSSFDQIGVEKVLAAIQQAGGVRFADTPAEQEKLRALVPNIEQDLRPTIEWKLEALKWEVGRMEIAAAIEQQYREENQGDMSGFDVDQVAKAADAIQRQQRGDRPKPPTSDRKGEPTQADVDRIEQSIGSSDPAAIAKALRDEGFEF